MEKFFLESCQLDEIEITEFLLHRYGNLDFMDKMDVFYFVRFYNKAIENDTKEKIYLQWLSMLPQMNKYIAFNEFYDTMTGRNIDTRPAEEIIAEIEELHKKKGAKDGS